MENDLFFKLGDPIFYESIYLRLGFHNPVYRHMYTQRTHANVTQSRKLIHHCVHSFEIFAA